MMDRRAFLITLAVTILAAPLAAKAQPAGKIPRVGVLRPGNPPPGDFSRQREAFEGGLRELGWTPGTNILIEYRYADGKLERLSELAADLVRLPVDVIVAGASSGVRAAQQATRTIPIVMSTLPDPVQEGFVANLAPPAGTLPGSPSTPRSWPASSSSCSRKRCRSSPASRSSGTSRKTTARGGRSRRLRARSSSR